MNPDMLKKREQYYLIEQENNRLHAFNTGQNLTSLDSRGGADSDFGMLLKRFPGIDYNNKSVRKILDHLNKQLSNLDVPLSDPKLRKMVEDYLKVLQTNTKVDCSEYQYIPVGALPTPKKLVIIGDLHADYCVTLDCLKLAGIIPQNVTNRTPINQIKCIAEPGTLVVQLGDQIDGDGRGQGEWAEPNCQSFLKIHQLFDHLNRSHKVYVLAVYGNHELMNLDNNFKYIPGRHLSKREAEEIKEYGIELMKQDIVCTRRPFWIVGNWLLVHGGLTDEWFNTFGGVAHAGNPEFSSEIAGRVLQNYYTLGPEEGNGLASQIRRTLDNGHRHGPNPTWNRSYGETGSCTKVPKLLKGIVKNIAVSHTVQDGYHITKSKCNGTNIFRLDTGMSRAFGRLGNPAVLIQENGKVYSHELLKNGEVVVKPL
jgi:hypothetical protein